MKKSSINIAIASAFAITLGACSPNLSSDEHISKSKEYLLEKKTNDAVIELKNAIRKAPKNVEARLLLGKAYLLQGDYKNAEKELNKSLELGADIEQVLPILSEIYYKLKSFEQVYSLIEQAETLSDEIYVIALTYAGMSAIYEQKFRDAQGYFDSAVQVSEDFLHSKISRGYMARSEEELQRAVVMADELIKAMPEQVDALLLKGYLLQALRKYKEAALTLIEYSQKRPKELSILFFIAQNYIRADMYAEADKTVESILAVAPKHPLANELKARILYQAESYAKVKQHAETALQENRDSIVSQVLAGISSYKLNELESAYQHLSKATKRLPNNSPVHQIFLELQLALGYDEAALGAIQEMVNSSALDTDSLLSLSNEFLASGNSQAAKSLLSSDTLSDDLTTSQVVQKSVLMIGMDDTERAIASLESLLEVEPNSESAQAGLAYGYMQNKEYDKALEIADKWLNAENTKSSGFFLTAAVAIERQDFESAAANMSEFLKLDDKNSEGYLKMATIQHRLKNYSEALPYYFKAMKLNPKSENTVLFISKLIIEEPSLAKSAIAEFESLLTTDPYNPLFKLGIANVHRVAGESDLALKKYEELDASEGVEGIEILVGDMFSMQDSTEQAVEYYNQYFDKNNGSIIAANRLIVAYDKLKMFKKASEVAEIIKDQYPERIGYQLLNAYYRTLSNQYVSPDDITMIKSDPAMSKHWLYFQVLGHMALANNQTQQAASKYQIAYEKNPSKATFDGLFRSLSRQGKHQEVVDLATQFIGSHGETAEVSTSLANAYIGLGNKQAAIGIYKELVDKGQANPLVLNNLAYFENERGNAKDALHYIERALTMTPSVPSLQDTYYKVLLNNNQFDKALVIIEGLLASTTADQKEELSFGRARALVGLGQKDNAKQLLLSLKKSARGDFAEQVSQLLNELN